MNRPLTEDEKREAVRQVIAATDRAWASGVDCCRPTYIELVNPDGSTELLYAGGPCPPASHSR